MMRILSCLLMTLWSTAGANPSCEWCGAQDAPASLDPVTTIAPADEPGQRLVLRGRVYQADGTTPAAGVMLYLYHTNARGDYPRRGDETGNGRRHGYLRGWVSTDETGRYEVRSIKPGSYPGRRDPAHIHITVKETDRAEYWVDSTLFSGDPRITEAERKGRETGRFCSIVELETEPDGSLTAIRNIRLKPEESDPK